MQIPSDSFDALTEPSVVATEAPARFRLSPIRRDAAFMLASGMIVRLCGLVFMMVLSRVLTDDKIGVFSLYEAIADTLTLIASFSLDMVTIRRVAAAARGEETNAFAPLLAFRILSTPVYLVAITLVCPFVSGPHWLLPLVGVYTLTESIFFSFGSFFAGVKRLGLRAIIEASTELVFTGLFLLTIRRYPSIPTLIVLSTLRSSLLLGSSYFFARRIFGKLHVRFETLQMIKSGAPFVLMALLGLLQGRTEIMLLGFLSSLPETGAYQLALRLIIAAGFIPQSLNLAIYPHIAADGLSGANRQRLRRLLLILGLFGAASGAALFCFPQPIARVLFGPMAGEVAPVLRAMSPALLVRFVTTGISSALIAMNGEKRVFNALLLGTVVGLAADCLLIPPYKASGAAMGMLLSALCQFVVMGVAILSAAKSGRAKEPPAASV
jgi:O-antigen/teichoic acid export membrane protein